MRQAGKLVLVALLGVAALGTTGCTELVDLFSDAVRGVSSDSGSGDPEGEILGKSGKAEAVPTFDHGPGDGVSSGLRAGLVEGDGVSTGVTGLGTMLPQGGNPYAATGNYLPTSTGAPRVVYSDSQGGNQGVSYSPYSPNYTTADASGSVPSSYVPVSNQDDQYGYDGNNRVVQVGRSGPASAADYSSGPSGYESVQRIETRGVDRQAPATVEQSFQEPSMTYAGDSGAPSAGVTPSAEIQQDLPVQQDPPAVEMSAPMEQTPASGIDAGDPNAYGNLVNNDHSGQGLGNLDMGMDPGMGGGMSSGIDASTLS